MVPDQKAHHYQNSSLSGRELESASSHTSCELVWQLIFELEKSVLFQKVKKKIC